MTPKKFSQERSNRKMLQELVLSRHSTRSFLNEPVPQSILYDVLGLAQRAPSSTNIQPWRLTIVSGQRLLQLTNSLVDAFNSNLPLDIPEIPANFSHFRSALGEQIYGPKGYNVSRDDKLKYYDTQVENFRFYNAPTVAVVAIDRNLNAADILSVGLYVQTLVLLLTDYGLGTCLQVSTVGYPDVVRRELGIGENMLLLCTLAVGYENPEPQINRLKMSREDWTTSVNFIEQ